MRPDRTNLLQVEFAEFVEQNSVDIVTPNPAAMMDDLQAITEDGQVRFNVAGGQITVPEQFTLNLPAFVGGPQVLMQALLRFRVNGGKLVIWYTLNIINGEPGK